MAKETKKQAEIPEECEELKIRLDEAEETLSAIQSGQVDAVVVDGPNGTQIFTLKGADYAYRILIEEMNEGVAILTTDLTIYYCNGQLASMLKLPLETIIGKPLNEVIPHEQFKCNIPSINEPDNSCEEELVIKVFDGTLMPVHINIRFLEKINGYYMIINDLTEQKMAEKELNNLLENLKRSNEELEKFAYVASHDLQEPLRTIASFTQLLEKRYKGKFDSDADEFMGYIVEAAIRMKDQIEGLLEFSRVATKGKEFEQIDLNEVLNQTINILNASITECKSNITYDELPVVIGDFGQLQRVFQNLISNAIKFRKCEEQLRIHISSQKDAQNNEYILSVADNGIGMEEQYLERIFVIFQRLHTRDVYKGTGIGLSVVKKIIERHGGRIWVESEYNKGSTFYFTLPIKSS